jgi:hypothetical protein
MIRPTLAALILVTIAGCGASGPAGTYHAEIRHTGTVTKERAEQLQSEPQQMLNLDNGGTFTTTRGTQTVWKGRWKVEANKLLLRAEEVNGIAVSSQLQDDVAFEIHEDGSIIDSRTSGDGYERVYRRP